MLSRYCAYPDFPSLRHNKYFRSCWEKQVAGVILEDRLDTPRRYSREASLQRAAMDDLHAEEAAASFITAWKDVWHPLSAKTAETQRGSGDDRCSCDFTEKVWPDVACTLLPGALWCPRDACESTTAQASAGIFGDAHELALVSAMCLLRADCRLRWLQTNG